jgi:hypothetical protein
MGRAQGTGATAPTLNQRKSHVGAGTGAGANETAPRFSIEKHFKRAHVWRSSNPTGEVADGFLLTDNLTGAKQICPTKRDALKRQQLKLYDEAALDWSKIAAWSASFNRYSSNHLLGVSGVDTKGIHVANLCVVLCAPADETVARTRIALWLEAMGHADLPEHLQ